MDDLILGAQHSPNRPWCDRSLHAACEVPDGVHPREQTTEIAHLVRDDTPAGLDDPL